MKNLFALDEECMTKEEKSSCKTYFNFIDYLVELDFWVAASRTFFKVQKHSSNKA